MPEPIEVRKVPLHHVSDASELAKLIDAGVLEADRVVAVIGKTEGNGGVNDYTRILADRAFREVLVGQGQPRRDAVAQIPIVWSGGTDGVISPHATIFATMPPGAADGHRRAAAVGRLRDERAAASRGHRPARDDHQGRGRRAGGDGAGGHQRPGRRALRADQDAAADDPHDPARESRGQSVWTENTGDSMDVSNGTAALGIAVALGEIAMPADADVMHDRALYSAGRLLLLRRRARPGAGGRGRQRTRDRRTVPDRPLGHARTRWTPTASGQRSGTRGSTCRPGRTRATWTAAWSTSS